MIDEILLTGDNSQLLKGIEDILATYSNIDNIKFKLKGNLESKPQQANQVKFHIASSLETEDQTLRFENDDEIAYACARPSEAILSQIKSCKLLAVQRHLFTNKNADTIFLGQLKNNIEYSEPSIRDASIFIFDQNALRASEVSHAAFSYPSGLFSEQATQMFRYAGMNERNKHVVILNATAENLDLVCQFIWYYAEAALQRTPDHPYFTNTVDEYVVNVDSLDLTVSFYKSKKSGRWWIKIPDIAINKWKSCSYEDYLSACEDQINADLLEAIAVVE